MYISPPIFFFNIFWFLNISIDRIVGIMPPEVFLGVCMYGHTYSKSMDQPGKVANPFRGQLNKENEYFPVRVRA